MKLILTPEKFKEMPYSGTEVMKSKTFGEIVGLLEAYKIEDYDWKRRKPIPPMTVTDEALEFPLDYTKSDGSKGRLIVHLDVPQIYKETKDGKAEYMEKASWRLFWWYIKARLEASFYGISSLEREFLYQITDERGVKLGERVMQVIKDEGLDRMLLEQKPAEPRREIPANFEVKTQ